MQYVFKRCTADIDHVSFPFFCHKLSVNITLQPTIIHNISLLGTLKGTVHHLRSRYRWRAGWSFVAHKTPPSIHLNNWSRKGLGLKLKKTTTFKTFLKNGSTQLIQCNVSLQKPWDQSSYTHRQDAYETLYLSSYCEDWGTHLGSGDFQWLGLWFVCLTDCIVMF